MKFRSIAQKIGPLMLVVLIAACGSSPDTSSEPAEAGTAGAEVDAPAGDDLGDVPEEHISGARAYSTWCAECHGSRGEGTDQGPPHVHIVYEPNHHPDTAFLNAARVGVSSHHWPFGDMAPVEGVTDEELDAIVDYVRYLQREAGIN